MGDAGLGAKGGEKEGEEAAPELFASMGGGGKGGKRGGGGGVALGRGSGAVEYGEEGFAYPDSDDEGGGRGGGGAGGGGQRGGGGKGGRK